VVSAGLCCKANGHNLESIPGCVPILLYNASVFWNLNWAHHHHVLLVEQHLNEHVRAALWLCCHYCDSMFFQKWTPEQWRPNFPWNADGETKKWKQRDFARTTLTFNRRNSEI